MLTLEGVSKTYSGGVQALNNVSLSVPPGMFGLLGPNGAGKSTLMRTIATLQAPDSGAIRFGNVDVISDPMALRRRLGYLPQEFGAFPRTSPEAMLRHLATLKGIAPNDRNALVDDLLVRTNLYEVRRKSVDTFSGGMRQRFGIAQALIGQPELVIVDEPTAGLDPAERRRFHNLLADIGDSVVVILSTHIVEDVAELCPQMAIMAGGRILAQGAPAALIADLEGRLWRKLINRGEPVEAQGQIISTRRLSGQLEVRVLADTHEEGATPAIPTLEDCYFATLRAHGHQSGDV